MINSVGLQGEIKRRAKSWRGFHPDTSVMPLYNFADDRQARSSATPELILSMKSFEYTEDRFQMLCRNSDSIIPDVKHERISCLISNLDPFFGAVIVLYRVTYEVLE